MAGQSVRKWCAPVAGRCRVMASMRVEPLMPAQKTEQHRAEVKKLGKVLLVGEYRGARTKTTYYCPKHGFTDEALPTNVLKGRGLLCCKQQGSQDAADRKKAKAAAKYDSELAKHSKLQRIEAYVDSKTPIKHRCLIHNEEHPVAPSDGRIGKGHAAAWKQAGPTKTCGLPMSSSSQGWLSAIQISNGSAVNTSTTDPSSRSAAGSMTIPQMMFGPCRLWLGMA